MINRLTRMLMWAGFAAVATYFLDPDRGDKRRQGLLKRMTRMQKAGMKATRKARVQAGL
jgi:hypothetical protein